MRRKWPTTPEWIRIRAELARVRRSLRQAIKEAEGVHFDQQQRELIQDSMRPIHELLDRWQGSLAEPEHDSR